MPEPADTGANCFPKATLASKHSSTVDSNKNYYAILGVLPSASQVAIRRAYKALVHRYHPDRFAGPTEEANRLMAEINEAYGVLSVPLKRIKYDKLRQLKPPPDGSFFKRFKPDRPTVHYSLRRQKSDKRQQQSTKRKKTNERLILLALGTLIFSFVILIFG